MTKHFLMFKNNCSLTFFNTTTVNQVLDFFLKKIKSSKKYRKEAHLNKYWNCQEI